MKNKFMRNYYKSNESNILLVILLIAIIFWVHTTGSGNVAHISGVVSAHSEGYIHKLLAKFTLISYSVFLHN